MTTQTETGTALALTPRQEKQLAIRDEMAPGAKPSAIVPRTFAEVQQMCQALAGAGIAPKAFKDKPIDMAMVMMCGAEVGIPPMAALRLYTTWDGVPRLMAEGVRGVIVSHPDCEYFEVATCDDNQATWITKRKNRPEKSVTWTMERAKKAGLLEKDNWKKYQQDMLNARASMQLGRLVWPDVVAGMVSREEAMDGDFIDASATETRSPGFTAVPAPAQKSDPVVMGSAMADAPKSAVSRHDAVMPRGSKAKPIEAKATEVPTSAASTTSTPPAGSSSPSPSVAPASTSSAPASTAQAPTPPASSSTKLEAAVAKVEAKRADPTPPAGSTEPATAESSPSTSSEASTLDPEGYGVSSTTQPAEEDDGFGGGDEPAAPPLAQLLRPFYEWLTSCKTRRELNAGRPKWMAWAVKQAQEGNPDFFKASPGVAEGKAAGEMSTAYAKRKTEVPE